MSTAELLARIAENVDKVIAALAARIEKKDETKVTELSTVFCRPLETEMTREEAIQSVHEKWQKLIERNDSAARQMSELLKALEAGEAQARILAERIKAVEAAKE